MTKEVSELSLRQKSLYAIDSLKDPNDAVL